MNFNAMYFSEKLMELRRSKGWSQEQLGEKLGVTRQTVSKWELGDTTPEMEKIAALSELFGITTDELIKGESRQSIPEEKTEQPAPLPESKPKLRSHYEYKSKRSWRGIPLVHVNCGLGKHHAKGVIAIGNTACGIISIGLASVGVVSVGIASIGLLVLASVVGLGVAAHGAVVAGLFAFGGVAAGLFAFGGVAVGWTTFGGLSCGAYSFGGAVFASDIGFGGNVNAHIAIGDTVKGAVQITEPMPAEQLLDIIYRELPNTPRFIADFFCQLAENLHHK